MAGSLFLALMYYCVSSQQVLVDSYVWTHSSHIKAPRAQWSHNHCDSTEREDRRKEEYQGGIEHVVLP